MTSAVSPDQPGGPSEYLPIWFERFVVVVAAATVSFGGFGLLMAVIGSYHALPVLLVGAVLTVGLSFLAWPSARLSAPPGRAVVAPALATIVVALAFAGWNGYHAGEHVAIGRDPGVYTVTAKWIAEHGNLEVKEGTDWTSKSSAVSVVSPGTYQVGPDQIQYQFAHMMPVLMAEANSLGGDHLMFRVPALLGGLALCAVYAVGCRLVRRPWLVLVAVGALAVSLPQINVARETLSESSVELLVWAGMFLLLIAYERRHVGVGLLAGLALGGTVMCHIDAPVYLIPLPILGALAWLSADPGPDRRGLARVMAAFVAGAIPVVVLGLYDLMNRAGTYYDDLHSSVHRLQLGFGASIVVAVALILLWPAIAPRVRSTTSWLSTRRGAIGTGLALIVAVGLLGAWALRPDRHDHSTPPAAQQALVGGLQRAAGLPYEPTRTYAEQTVVWLSWYLGPVTVALGILGISVLLVRNVRKFTPEGTVVLSVAGIGTALYLWNPDIVPDQIWAMRRFVPVGIPLLVLLAAAGIATIGAWLRATGIGTREAGAVQMVAALGVLFFPFATTYPVRDFQPQAGYLAAVEDTCRSLGPNAAVLTATNDVGMTEVVSALRAWCGYPVAVLNQPLNAQQLQQLDAAWRAGGKTLWIVGSSPATVHQSAPGLNPAPIASAANPRELEMTISRPPAAYQPGPLTIYGSPAS